MRAAIYERPGPASQVLRVVELERPEPGPGEVRVRVVFSAVNPTDWKMRAGSQGQTLAHPFQIPNQDGAGVIDAVGGGVSPTRVNERVWLYFTAFGRQFGSASEWVCVPERLAVPLPERSSFELGASLGVPALTAHHTLFADGPIRGKTVLVAGGAGAVGHFAIELGKWAGARIITTVSSAAKAELAQKAGADLIINYRDDDVVEKVRAAVEDGVDRVIEVAPENLGLDLDVIGPLGTVVLYASTGTDPIAPVRRLMTANTTLRFMLLYGLPAAILEQGSREVNDAITAGALSELPCLHFPLDEIARAHDAVEAGATGKVLVDLG